MIGIRYMYELQVGNVTHHKNCGIWSRKAGVYHNKKSLPREEAGFGYKSLKLTLLTYSQG